MTTTIGATFENPDAFTRRPKCQCNIVDFNTIVDPLLRWNNVFNHADFIIFNFGQIATEADCCYEEKIGDDHFHKESTIANNHQIAKNEGKEMQEKSGLLTRIGGLVCVPVCGVYIGVCC